MNAEEREKKKNRVEKEEAPGGGRGEEGRMGFYFRMSEREETTTLSRVEEG